MKQNNSAITTAKDQVERASAQVARSPWVERLARFGYAAKGTVYIVVGVLAVQATFGGGRGQITDTRGALETIVAKPFGTVLLGIVAIGLIGFVLWRFVQAAMDPEHQENDHKSIGRRIAYTVSGLVYAGLALSALRIIMGSGGNGGSRSQGSSSSNAARDWTAWLLAQPFGKWLVALVGVIVIGVGIYQLYKAYTAKFREKLKLNEMSDKEEMWATRISKFGLVARGIVFGVVGIFLIQAALRSDPTKAQGLDGALRALAGQPFGSWILCGVAAGLVAYGIYMLVQARYRRIATS